MAVIDLKGTKKARKPFICPSCGDTFYPPSRYVLLRLGKKMVKVCLLCEGYG